MKKDLSCTGDMLGFGVGICALAALLFGLSGCSIDRARAVVDLPPGGYAIVTTAEGMRAAGEVQNGFITNTKASADVKSAYWQQRELHDKELTLREKASRFWGKFAEAWSGKE